MTTTILRSLFENAMAIVLALALLVLALLVMHTPSAYAEESSCAPAEVAAGAGPEWRFSVFLDDSKIGCHNYYLRQQADGRQLLTVADFEYRLLFLTLYDYRHENKEIWQEGCLRSIESSTDVNGRSFSIQGQENDQGFEVHTTDGVEILPDCVMSFAYWNPEFLQTDRLLNTQNGAYVDIEVRGPVHETLHDNAGKKASLRYRLEADKIAIDLWYSEDGDWLALETEARGKTLRYERVYGPGTRLTAELAP